MTDRKQLVRMMRTLFQVWNGTENADDILDDVCRVLGSNVLNIPISTTDTRELERFVSECRDGVAER